jgi:hypothetical protein
MIVFLFPSLETTPKKKGKEKKQTEKPHSFRILVRNPSFNLRFCADSDDFSRAQKRFVIVLKGMFGGGGGKREGQTSVLEQKTTQHI